MPARRCWVALALLLLGSCATLTADQQAGLDEAKAFLAAAAKAYGVWTPGLVVGSTTNEGGYYRGGTIFMRDSMLTWKYRDATLAHEFSHYLLGHESRKVADRHAWQREQEIRERDANIKSVEVLMRAKGLTQAEAIQLVRGKLEGIARAYQRGVSGAWVPGHKPPAEEVADFLAAFPAAATAGER
jgi:hypothetical protein